MKTQTVRFLSILREYLKVWVPVITILLALISPSLALANSSTQVYARVWVPANTESLQVASLRCAVGGCSVLAYNQCLPPPKNPDGSEEITFPTGVYNDLGWQGHVGYMLSITAYSQPNCKDDSFSGLSDNSFLGYGSDYVKAGGDCWFDIPNGSVSGACTGKTDPSAGQSSSSVS